MNLTIAIASLTIIAVTFLALIYSLIHVASWPDEPAGQIDADRIADLIAEADFDRHVAEAIALVPVPMYCTEEEDAIARARRMLAGK